MICILTFKFDNWYIVTCFLEYKGFRTGLLLFLGNLVLHAGCCFLKEIGYQILVRAFSPDSPECFNVS